MTDKKKQGQVSFDSGRTLNSNVVGASAPSSARPRTSGATVNAAGRASQRVGGASSQPNGSKGSNKHTVIIVLGVVVVAIAIWLLIWIFACGGPGVFDQSARDGQAPYKTEEEIQAELNRTVEEGMFNISIASAIQFKDGESEGTAYIENVPGNHYLMKVRINDDATGELLYESGVLKPNQYIENIALTQHLDQGSYPATATFTAMDQTTYEEIGQAAAKVVINVEN